jgi:uncharacterized protein YjdB
MRNKKALLSLVFILIMALLSSGCFPGGILIGLPVIDSISNQTGKVGQEFTYQVMASDPDNGELTYSLSEKPEGMQIGSSAGLITWTPGESQIGTFTVGVKVSNGNGFSLEQFEITIEDASTISASLTSIQVSPVVMSIYMGYSFTINSITAFYDDEKSSASIALNLAVYQSSNTNIATVNNSGLITGVSAGSAVITVNYTEGGITRTATIDVTVVEAPKVLTSIVVLPSSMSMHIGDSEIIASITAHYDDESNTTIGLDSVSYSSNHINIASVNTTGRVAGVSAGSATITVTYTEGGITKTDTVSVTVTEAPKVLTSITVLPSSMSIRKGQSQTINSITAYYNNGTNANIELSACNYQSNETNVTVTNGVIKVSSTCAATTAIVTVSYTEGGVTKSDTVNITITGGG